MKLAASLVIRNELGRYLEPCIDHLLAFCDLVVVLDDASDDGTREYLIEHPDERLVVEQQSRSTFYVHEGHTRQKLIDATLAHNPTHVLSIDADEFVSDGELLRQRIEGDPGQPVWQLSIEEIWNANDHLYVREDGGWRTHGLAVLWKAPPPGISWRILDRKLACRRVPMQVLSQTARATPTNVELMHFGWTDRTERQRRYDRYTRHDNGKFHASSHLRSIMWPETRIRLRQREWPYGAVFSGLRDRFAPVAA